MKNGMCCWVVCGLIAGQGCWGALLYVDGGSTNPVSPYGSWSTAATTIQGAVDAAGNGDTVWVTNGHYVLSSEISVQKDITVISVNGAESTIVDGNGSSRCFNLGSSACVVSGFTITNGYHYNLGGGVYCHYNTTPRVEHCTIVGNQSRNGGGGIHYGSVSNCIISDNRVTLYNGGGGTYGTLADHCVIRNNRAKIGAGMLNGTANHCTITGNTAFEEGGGVYNGTLTNCLVSGNSSGLNGGGMHSGTAINCTFTGNTAKHEGGGMYRGTANNCIVFYNQPSDTHDTSGENSCAPELTHGSDGNITNNPSLLSMSHIATNSPCVGAGSDLYSSGTDLDGDAWQSPPSMGCDEKVANETPTGEIQLLLGGPARVLKDRVTTYFVQVLGNVSSFEVDFGNGDAFTNTFIAATQWSATGTYSVVLSAVNDDFPAGVIVTQTISVMNPEDVEIFVSKTGSDSNDGTSWADAKATIQAGVDAQDVEGGTVWVGDGHFIPSATITVNKPIILESLNGAEATIIDGSDTHSCLNLRGSACTVRGFTITNGYGAFYLYPGGGGVFCLTTTPVIEDCIVVHNRTHSGYDGGGLVLGTANRCRISNNTAGRHGGGMMGGLANNCIISGNTAGRDGGGMRQGTANNCVMTGNRAGEGGGAMAWGEATHCTIVGNAASSAGGFTAYNCILRYNLPEDSYSVTAYNSCAPETTFNYGSSGANGNITNDPLLVSASHIATNSPCRAAGDPAYSFGTDIDGDLWENPPSMGCDEKQLGEIPAGDLQLFMQGPQTVILGNSASYFIPVIGNASSFRVDFDDGTVVSNQLQVSVTWSTTGTYNVVASAVNTDHPAGVMVTQAVTVVNAEDVMLYVSTTGNDLDDGRSWAQAKATIQAGIDAQNIEGGTILVGDGVYVPQSTLLINKPVILKSLNGAGSASIDGQGLQSCLNLSDNDCVVSGFTITNGNARYSYGGGVYCRYDKTPLVEHCIIVNNQSDYGGGGMYHGVANHCTIAGNSTKQSGGGSYQTTLNNCRILENSAGYDGGAAYSAKLNNCLVVDNTASNWAGGVYSGSLSNCTVVGNSSEGPFGGVYQSKVYNSIIWSNTTRDLYPNGIPDSLHNSCITPVPTWMVDGNIDIDPQFVSASNFHLTASSPCVDAGNNLYMCSAQDLDGNPRPLDGDGNGTANIDMGCYEAVTSGDTDGDHVGDLSEQIAGTDLLDPTDYFHVSFMGGSSTSPTLQFQSLTDRQYRMAACDDLMEGNWEAVAGAEWRMGYGGADSMNDTNQLAPRQYYRLEVKKP